MDIVRDAASRVRDTEEVEQSIRPTLAWTAVGILLLFTMLSALDRSIIALMVDPIRKDLNLTDMQFSLLQGFAFVLFYALASLPMAWLADRISRQLVIFGGVVFWSVSTALCGMAGNFWQLFAARLGVGAGEATLSPSSYALVSEIFPTRRVATAIGVLAAGQALGSGIAYGVGGAVVEWTRSLGPVENFAPWQLAFILVGLPGILIAPLVILIPRTRPGRVASVGHGIAHASRQDGYLEWLRANKGYLVPLMLGVGFHAILAYCWAMWTPAYLERRFALTPSAIGGMLGLCSALGGLAGFVGGGWLVDRLHARGVRDAHLRYCLLGCPLFTVFGALAYTVVDSVPVFLGMVMLMGALSPLTAPVVAHLALATPSAFAARTIALLTVTFNLLGMSLGPTSAAFFSDRIYGGSAHIGSGVATAFLLFGPIATLLFAVALRPAREAVARAHGFTRSARH